MPASAPTDKSYATEGKNQEKVLLDKVREEIETHRKMVAKQSYLQRAVSFVHHSGDVSLRELMIVGNELKELVDDQNDPQKRTMTHLLSKEEANSIDQQIQTDRIILEHELRTSASAARAISMAPLFVPGPWGWGLSAALTAANTALPSDSIGEQLADVSMGALNGLISNKLATTTLLPAGYLTRAPFLVAAQTAGQTAFNSHAYINQNTGEASLAQGLKATWRETSDWRNLGVAASSLLLSGGGAAALNLLTRGAINAMPILATESTAAISGFSSSAIADMKEHFSEGKEFSAQDLITDGFANAALAMVTAAPGGLTAQYQVASAAQRSPLKNDRLEMVQTPHGERKITVHLPNGSSSASTADASTLISQNHNASRPDRAPLRGCVIAMHGCFQSAEALARDSGLNELSEEMNVMVVYLHGTPLGKGTPLEDESFPVWGALPDSFVNSASKTADNEYIAAVIKRVQENYGMRPSQIVIDSFSGAAAQASSYVAEKPDQVAGLYTVAGGLTASQSVAKPAGKPTSIVQELIHSDNVILENGGWGPVPILPRRESFRRWSEALGMPEGASTIVRDANTISMSKFRTDGAELTQIVSMRPPCWVCLGVWVLGYHKWPAGATERLSAFINRVLPPAPSEAAN